LLTTKLLLVRHVTVIMMHQRFDRRNPFFSRLLQLTYADAHDVRAMCGVIPRESAIIKKQISK